MDRTVTDAYFAPAIASAKEAELRCEGFSRYLDSAFLQRLKGVSFLGVLDYVYELQAPSNRYVHTICVSHLALELSRRFELPRDLHRAFVIANILHDVGHAAFSHNSEPFLVEQLNLYHQGLLSAFLVHTNRFSPDGMPLARLLDAENDVVSEMVTNLILQSRRAIRPLEDLFHCPLNCDKIEGNHRTLCHLDKESILPENLLALLSVQEGEVFVNRSDIGIIVDFWRKERDVYWNDIYTSDVFSGEAMLTRALQNFFEGPSQAESFLFMTDDEAIEAMETCNASRDLVRDLKANRLFLSMNETCPEVLREFEPRLRKCRFDKFVRRKIEADIAEVLSTRTDQVISHFSRRKYFESQFGELHQMELYADDPHRLALEKVICAFQNSKRPGDFFDVFYSLA